MKTLQEIHLTMKQQWYKAQLVMMMNQIVESMDNGDADEQWQYHNHNDEWTRTSKWGLQEVPVCQGYTLKPHNTIPHATNNGETKGS